ncbi:hypothetical protein FHS83_003715 [Rhizomicrobium palustre]|uniref:Uncharacterized protein n=1 Tax=Rhizomicrobium palustre TaxID=189966 RepID=A0A846N5T7_9PROT|nr:DUF6655 family protein [Rhizomicrobium palustre]NIK90397.1 hypothetical protein [Rhizomicrobium palustre]
MIQKLLPLSLAMILLCGCTTVRATNPARTAAEELLISTAADRAAEKLAQSVPVGLTAYFDGQYIAGTDAPYAAATMRDQLLRHGVNLIDDKSKAEAVITPRMGALASNEISTVLGLPGLPVPSLLMPGASLTTPELNLFKQEETDGLAKFAATVTDTKTGKLIVATDPAYGYSRRSSWVLLFFITWHESDLGKGEKNPDYRILP